MIMINEVEYILKCASTFFREASVQILTYILSGYFVLLSRKSSLFWIQVLGHVLIFLIVTFE